ncbi:hypothetical protein GCM10009557_21110 [Virgisporangium ochraceum]|uniref:DUF397 domain-containing protein n=1 Tax=Virgisporangium ochraceum TaxID=65505 RepID=A0A8J4E9Q0_9ACTN|nr:hypothetical protein Voc01_014700 [Virgisporangium ochraceum]
MATTNSVFKASTRCTGGACVEVAVSTSAIIVRDGKDRQGSVLSFGPVEWRSFLDAVKSGSVGSADG